MPAKSTAATDQCVRYACTASPRDFAQASEASSTHDAPSVSGVLLPAVSVPAALRSYTGFSAASFDSVVSSAWQNWIFNRPNAVGEQGALKLFGTGSKAQFKWERV